MHHIAGGITIALACITLLVAMIGIFGVLSYGVSMRKFELGVRMAIGAAPIRIVKNIINENLMAIVIAIAIATLIMLAVLLWLHTTHINFNFSILGYVAPITLILFVTTFASLLSVWRIIRSPAICSLRDN